MANGGFEASTPQAGWSSWIPQLLPNEQVLWEGRPSKQPIALQPRDLFMIPFSIFWAGFAVFWNASVWTRGAPLSFSLFGLPFLAVGFYVTIGRFAHNWYLRSGTRYALTSHRALIKRGGLSGRRVAERYVGPHDQIETSSGRGGNGTIRFGTDDFSLFQMGSSMRSWTSWSETGVAGFQFWKIPDADRVISMIRARQHQLLENRSDPAAAEPTPPAPWRDQPQLRPTDERRQGLWTPPPLNDPADNHTQTDWDRFGPGRSDDVR